jgi:outer membrane protein assembly factor BamB
MVSLWPVRTGVLVENDIVYAAAGVFPYEGLYVCAVDARTGKELWKNDTAGDLAWGLGYGGMAPQGYLVASDNLLFVPAGRSMPAAFDKKTGGFVKFLDAGGKIGGSWTLMDDDQLIAGVNNQGTPAKIAYDSATGKRRGDLFASFPGKDLVLTPKTAFSITQDGIYSIDRANYRKAKKEIPELSKKIKALTKEIADLRKEYKEKAAKAVTLEKDAAAAKELEQLNARLTALDEKLAEQALSIAELEGSRKDLEAKRLNWQTPRIGLTIAALAGDTLIAGGNGFVLSLNANTGEILDEHQLKGVVLDLAVAHGRLFVGSDEGPIHCFGDAKRSRPDIITEPTRSNPYRKDPLRKRYQAAAETILEQSQANLGFCLVINAGEGHLAYEIARRSELSVVALETNPEKLKIAREKLDSAGFYGNRVIVEPWDLADLPDYFANLLVSDSLVVDGTVTGSVDELRRIVRPAGGVALFGHPKGVRAPADFNLRSWLAGFGGMPPRRLTVDGEWWKLTRRKLEGAADWTSLYGNSANTGSIPDHEVRGPFGVLWYGEPGSQQMPERHARSVSPLAVNGRLFVQGMEVLQAYDAYNGTLLWERKIPGAVRVRVDVDGSNLSATDNSIFVATYDKTLQLDAQTGEEQRAYAIPTSADGNARRWGYIAATERILYGSGAMPLERDYAFLWNNLVEDGRWKSRDQLPAALHDALYAIKGRGGKSQAELIQEKYPVPNKQAYDYFKRAGLHWRLMNTFPGWLPDHRPGPVNDTTMLSDSLAAFDTQTGEPLWKHEARGIPNITITLGDRTIFFVKDDLTEEEKHQALRDRDEWIQAGIYEPHDECELEYDKKDIRRVVALDRETGREIWSRPVDLTGCGATKLGTAYQSGKLLLFGHYSNHDEGPFVRNSLAWRRITVFDGATGSCVWSKPLNYRRRPLVMGDTIYIEPRACYLANGEIKMRPHPITGEPVEWEFLRPGHSCGIVTASPYSIFYRSFCPAIVDVERDSGLQLFGGMRPGCWNNLIPGNGLLNFQEASSGCTCSYSIRSTVVLKNKKQKDPGEWSVFITKGAMTPVSHLALNFGAPGDMRDDNGTLWFGYPRPNTSIGQGSFRNYGVKFDLKERLLAGMGVVQRDFRNVTIEGSTRPWLFTSALAGLQECTVPLLDGEAPGKFTVRIGFVAAQDDKPGRKVFDLKLNGQQVLTTFDPLREAGRAGKAVIKEFQGIQVKDDLIVELVPSKTPANTEEAPHIHFLEIIREDAPAKPAEEAAATQTPQPGA